jgi:hypothetical protein
MATLPAVTQGPRSERRVAVTLKVAYGVLTVIMAVAYAKTREGVYALWAVTAVAIILCMPKPKD